MNSFKDIYLAKYPGRGNVMKKMEAALGHVPVWEDFTRHGASVIIGYLRENCAPNSARTYSAEIKSVLNEYGDVTGINVKDIFSRIRIRQVPVISVYLTPEEIRLIERYEPLRPIERSVKARFLLESWCGARMSDISMLQKENIDFESMTIKYVSQKTGIMAEVPLHSKFMDYLDDARSMDVYDMTFNRTIRRICRKQGIRAKVKVFHAGKEEVGEKWEFVSSHTARRSFATNCVLNGMSLTNVMAFMGHSDVNMTKRYIVSSKPNISDSVRRRLFGEMRKEA